MSGAGYSRNRIESVLLKAEFPDSYRIVPERYRALPLGTSPADSRFCSRDAGYTVLYASPDFATAFIEAVVRGQVRTAAGTGSRIEGDHSAGLGAHLGAAGNAPDPACWWIGDSDARSFVLAHIGRNQPRAFAYPLSVCPCSRHTRRWSSQNCWRSVRRAFERGIACTIADTLRGILDGAPWHGRQPYGITHSTRRTTFPSFSMISVRTVARISPLDQRATRPP